MLDDISSISYACFTIVFDFMLYNFYNKATFRFYCSFMIKNKALIFYTSDDNVCAYLFVIR
jgi:hypothetical protein